MTTLDPRIKAANIRAAADEVAEAAARVECLEASLNDLDHMPRSAANITRRFALHFQLSNAERHERHAIRHARRKGLQDGREYRADLYGQPCWVLLDGPCVTLYQD